MQLKSWLLLGRVSNLPTVWSNVLAAALVARQCLAEPGLSYSALTWVGALLSLSMMYLGGMFLNDAFDVQWDRENNNPRPLVTGEIPVRQAWTLGLGLLTLGVALSSYTQLMSQNTGISAWCAGTALAVVILSYNGVHKRFKHSAFLMGLCRMGVYVVAAILLAELSWLFLLAAVSLCFYIASITYIARGEHQNALLNKWPLLLLFFPLFSAYYLASRFNSIGVYFILFSVFFTAIITQRAHALMKGTLPVKAAVGALLAGIPLVDGLLLASASAWWPALACVVLFFCLPYLHRWVTPT
jgi:4-hydroxybenzoate polyprenyltransferase